MVLRLLIRVAMLRSDRTSARPEPLSSKPVSYAESGIWTSLCARRCGVTWKPERSVVFRSHVNLQIGELASGWLSLVLDSVSDQNREIVYVTPGLVSAFCRLGESGSAQARVFAGICLQKLLKRGGGARAASLISLASFSPCINSMLCSPLPEERLSGTLILSELISQDLIPIWN